MSTRHVLAVGSTVLVGAAGNLVLTGPAVAVAGCAGQRATIVGTDRAETIRGTRRGDVIVARNGADVILARGGDDVVCAGRGDDVVRGARGRDRLLGGLDRRGRLHTRIALFGDSLFGGAGDDRLIPGLDTRRHQLRFRYDELHFDTAAHGVRINLARGRATGQGHDCLPAHAVVQVWGSTGPDVFIGSDRPDRISDLGGADLVRGRAGNDSIDVDADPDGADDTVIAGAGDDEVFSNGGSDVQRGGDGNDLLSAVHAPARIFGGPGRDVVQYGFGPTTGQPALSGGPGPADQVQLLDLLTRGNTPNDRGPGVGSFDMVTGAMTFDLTRDPGSVALAATEFEQAAIGNDISGNSWHVRGTDGPNLVKQLGSLPGDMRFGGLAGDDVFEANLGDDFYDGGPGTDTGVFMANNGTDTCISVEQFRDSSPCPAAQP